MKISMVSDGKKAIQEWEKNQELVKDIDGEPLLLPVDYKFEEQGMCGSTGVLHVITFIYIDSIRKSSCYSQRLNRKQKRFSLVFPRS